MGARNRAKVVAPENIPQAGMPRPRRPPSAGVPTTQPAAAPPPFPVTRPPPTAGAPRRASGLVVVVPLPPAVRPRWLASGRTQRRTPAPVPRRGRAPFRRTQAHALAGAAPQPAGIPLHLDVGCASRRGQTRP